MESRRERVVECSCGFCLFAAAPAPIRPLPMMDWDGVPDFCLFGSFGCFSFAAARRAWKACGQSLFALFSGFGLWAWIAPILPTLPLVGVVFVNWRFGFGAARRAWKACGQSSFALRSGFGFGAWIDHASHTLRCRRPVPVRRSSYRNNPAGLLINDSFRGWAVDMWTILICAVFGFRALGLDCPHSHSPIRPRPGLAKASLNRHREAIFASPCAAPSSAFVEVGDGTAISWLRCSSFRRFGGEPAQSSVRASFLGRPLFFGGGGGAMGAFVRMCSGMRSACSRSR